MTIDTYMTPEISFFKNFGIIYIRGGYIYDDCHILLDQYISLTLSNELF